MKLMYESFVEPDPWSDPCPFYPHTSGHNSILATPTCKRGWEMSSVLQRKKGWIWWAAGQSQPHLHVVSTTLTTQVEPLTALCQLNILQSPPGSQSRISECCVVLSNRSGCSSSWSGNKWIRKKSYLSPPTSPLPAHVHTHKTVEERPISKRLHWEKETTETYSSSWSVAMKSCIFWSLCPGVVRGLSFDQTMILP